MGRQTNSVVLERRLSVSEPGSITSLHHKVVQGIDDSKHQLIQQFKVYYFIWHYTLKDMCFLFH